MHEVVFYVAVAWMTGLLVVTVLFVIRAQSPMVRVLALDKLTLILTALLILLAAARRESYYLDAALGLALLSFLATLAASRYHAEGRVFR